MNRLNWLEVVVQDLRYGLRQLRRRPGFALAAIVSLALGIGANTAIFTLVDQIVLRLLPVEKPHELVRLRLDGSRPGGNWGDGIHTFPYPTYLALRDRNTVFSGLTATILAIVGVHRVLVFQVARRTREIGVRMALGAGRAGIVRLVASEMALVILAGLAAGVAAAYASGRYVQSQLFGLDADDPFVFGAAVGILLLSAALATLMPALRASRIEVVRALRCE